ncbi:leucine-rich repeat-containing protein 45 isoform X4 [Lemur catta]|uniref:leucine-rich repeat-containing protein 45 isoform X4 n=1 Tax=Lemur catta TaxID=9447 RepID=UPI001E269FC0|nr:leucine-rich repeat-containing protein 45 isoform X4 [Lemur catta]
MYPVSRMRKMMPRGSELLPDGCADTSGGPGTAREGLGICPQSALSLWPCIGAGCPACAAAARAVPPIPSEQRLPRRWRVYSRHLSLQPQPQVPQPSRALCHSEGSSPPASSAQPLCHLQLLAVPLPASTLPFLSRLRLTSTATAALAPPHAAWIFAGHRKQAMDHNQDRHATFRESQARTHVLSKEVRHLREEKSKQFLDLMETIDKQREEMARGSRASAARVGQLQEALNERQSIINALKAKLQMTEAALALSEQKAQDLRELLAAAEQEQLSQSQKQAKERRLEQQEAAERESKLLRDLSAANEKNLSLRNQVDELERKVKSQQEQLFLTRQELTNTSAELKIRAVQAEERLDMEKRRSRQSLEDAENLRLKEVEHMTRHLEESERAMQERVQRLEATRLSLEEELSRVKAAALSQRSQAEEELIKARSQAHREEQQHLAHLEDKLRLLTLARDEAQGTCLLQQQKVVEAQARAGQLSLQVDGLQRRLEELQQELSSKDQEKVAEVNRVRVELQEQNGRLQAELTAQEALREKVAALERQLKVLARDHREALRDRESENASLREKLRLREVEIARVRDEEAQRASLLQSAVLAYVQGTPPRALSPQK